MKKYFYFLIIVVTSLSCSNNDQTSSNNNQTSNQINQIFPVKTYVIGDVNGNAKYWINGVEHSLPNGSGGGNYGSFPKAIAIVGSDVYIVGNEFLTGQVYRVKVWKNGVITDFTNFSNTINYGFPNAICVAGNDIYISGYEQINFGWSPNVAKIWKNGIATILTDGSKEAKANANAAVGNDIYTVGHEGNEARLWINGILATFDPSAVSLTKIKVVGNDVYIAGYKNNGSNNVATIWKNGAVVFSHNTSDQIVNDFTIVGNDIYEAGYASNGANKLAKVWKNNIDIGLYNNSTEYSAVAINVVGTDIYTESIYYDNNNNNLRTLKFWKNGTDTTINTNYNNYNENLNNSQILIK